MSRKEILDSKKIKKIVLCFLLTATMVLSTGFTQNNIHTVTIAVDGKIMETRTTHTSPDVILARAGVKLDSKDEYTLRQIDSTLKNTVASSYLAETSSSFSLKWFR